MEKVLVFKNINSRNYWFKYVVNYFKINDIDAKANLNCKEIQINEDVLLFKTENEIDERFRAGRHNTGYYTNLEKRFEKDFIRTLGVIIWEKEKH